MPEDQRGLTSDDINPGQFYHAEPEEYALCCRIVRLRGCAGRSSDSQLSGGGFTRFVRLAPLFKECHKLRSLLSRCYVYGPRNITKGNMSERPGIASPHLLFTPVHIRREERPC